MKQNTDARNTLQQELCKFYQAMKEGCPLFILYAYDEDRLKRLITAESQITANGTYFNGVFPKEKAGNIWFNIYFGIGDELLTLRETQTGVLWIMMCHFCPENYRSERAIDTSGCITPMKKIKKDVLCEAIKDTALEMYGINLKITLVWSLIKDGTPWRP